MWLTCANLATFVCLFLGGGGGAMHWNRDFPHIDVGFRVATRLCVCTCACMHMCGCKTERENAVAGSFHMANF